jgi:hypothetical protein
LRAIDIPLRRMDPAGEGLPRALIDSGGSGAPDVGLIAADFERPLVTETVLLHIFFRKGMIPNVPGLS